MTTRASYPRLARLMSLEPSTAIFRQFNELTIMNLLRVQAELHSLEIELKKIREDDEKSNDPIRRRYTENFHLMRLR